LRLAAAVLASLSIAVSACNGHSTTKPMSAVDAYADALRSGNYARAYELMSEKYRREHTREEFVKMMRESPEEVRETAARLGGPGRKVEVSARFVYDELRDELALVEEGGSWKLATNPLDFYPQDTPQRALRSFVRAVELARWDVVLRFVPNKWREVMTADNVKNEFSGEKKEETQTMMRLLAANLDNPIEQMGDEARMQYGDRYEVKFVREDGLWKIADPD
jgi:hypothetical protein